MNKEQIIQKQIEDKVFLKASRSSGAGGQHVNKTSSKVTGIIRFEDLVLESDEFEKLQNRFGNQLVMWSQNSRSQLENRKDVVYKIVHAILETIQEQKPRRATAPSKNTLESIRRKKQIISQKKQSRRWDMDAE